MMAPHLGRIIGAAHRSQLRHSSAVSRPTAPPDLRIVVSR
jgi:hypothetical protein